MHRLQMALLALLPSVFGCTEAGEDDVSDVEIADTLNLAGTTRLYTGCVPGSDNSNVNLTEPPHCDNTWKTLLSHNFTVGSGQGIYLSGYGDPTATSDAHFALAGLRIKCSGSDRITSSENHLTMDPEWQRVRMLFAPPAGTYTCNLDALTADFHDGIRNIDHIYDQDTSFSHSANKDPGTWWHWGTENDSYRETCVPGQTPLCTFIGPNSCDPGETECARTEEYILRSPQFSA